jgi:hypothetical protein
MASSGSFSMSVSMKTRGFSVADATAQKPSASMPINRKGFFIARKLTRNYPPSHGLKDEW